MGSSGWTRWVGPFTQINKKITIQGQVHCSGVGGRIVAVPLATTGVHCLPLQPAGLRLQTTKYPQHLSWVCSNFRSSWDSVWTHGPSLYDETTSDWNRLRLVPLVLAELERQMDSQWVIQSRLPAALPWQPCCVTPKAAYSFIFFPLFFSCHSVYFHLNTSVKTHLQAVSSPHYQFHWKLSTVGVSIKSLLGWFAASDAAALLFANSKQSEPCHSSRRVGRGLGLSDCFPY